MIPARANTTGPPGASSPRADDDNPMATLGLGVFLTLLIVAGVMLSGAVIDAFMVVYAAVPVFLVAFASAPLFARLPLKGWATRGAVLGSVLGWALSAPLGAAINIPSNALYETENLFEFLPRTWLWALVPLAAVMLVAGMRQRGILRNRD